MNYTYEASFAKDKKDRYEELLSILKQYTLEKETEIQLKFYLRNNSRIITASISDKIVGFYLYTGGSRFFNSSRNLQISQELIRIGVDLDKSTVAILSLIDKEIKTDEVYYNMNKLRVADAKSQGYSFGIVNMNAGEQEYYPFCRMLEFSEKSNFFEKLSNTRIEDTGLKNMSGRPILIQYY